MGKGDIKTRRGKIAKGSFGVSRPHNSTNDKESDQTKEKEPRAKKSKTKSTKK